MNEVTLTAPVQTFVAEYMPGKITTTDQGTMVRLSNGPTDLEVYFNESGNLYAVSVFGLVRPSGVRLDSMGAQIRKGGRVDFRYGNQHGRGKNTNEGQAFRDMVRAMAAMA